MVGPVMLEAREARGPFGVIVKILFYLFQAVMILALLGTCAFIVPFVGADDPEVAAGAGMFGLAAMVTLWFIWPIGTILLGLLVLLTRGRKRLVAVPPAPTPPPRGGQPG